MTVRKIMIFPEDKAVLRAKSDSIRSMDQRTKRLIADLKDTLLSCQDGVGLAAPQINEHLRVVVVRLGAQNGRDSEAGPPVALVNPEIIEAGEERRDFDGCLSFPGLYGETIRPHFLRVTSLNEDGDPVDEIYQGFDAVVLHHEIDHLDGVLFIDRVKTLKDLYRVEKDASGNIRSLSMTHIT
jgi:peptide deformylase